MESRKNSPIFKEFRIDIIISLGSNLSTSVIPSWTEILPVGKYAGFAGEIWAFCLEIFRPRALFQPALGRISHELGLRRGLIRVFRKFGMTHANQGPKSPERAGRQTAYTILLIRRNVRFLTCDVRFLMGLFRSSPFARPTSKIKHHKSNIINQKSLPDPCLHQPPFSL